LPTVVSCIWGTSSSRSGSPILLHSESHLWLSEHMRTGKTHTEFIMYLNHNYTHPLPAWAGTHSLQPPLNAVSDICTKKPRLALRGIVRSLWTVLGVGVFTGRMPVCKCSGRGLARADAHSDRAQTCENLFWVKPLRFAGGFLQGLQGLLRLI